LGPASCEKKLSLLWAEWLRQEILEPVLHRHVVVTIPFGGRIGESRTADTGRYDGHRWEELSGREPEPRNHESMAYDEARGALVLFGGHDGDFVFGDTWERRAGAWSRVCSERPRRRVDNGH